MPTAPLATEERNQDQGRDEAPRDGGGGVLPTIRSEIPTPSASPTLPPIASSGCVEAWGEGFLNTLGAARYEKFQPTCGASRMHAATVPVVEVQCARPGIMDVFGPWLFGVSTILFVGGLVAKEFATGFTVV